MTGQTGPQRGYGWIPQKADQRDQMMAPMSIKVLQKVPVKMSMRAEMPEVFDQGIIGSCTGQSVAAIIQHLYKKAGKPAGNLRHSRLFPYYNARELEGTANSDAGAVIRDVIKCASKYGSPFEAKWPYDTTHVFDKPPADVYTSATENPVRTYKLITQTKAGIIGALSLGHPIVFGFTVYESFESDAMSRTGMMPMPKPNERVLGGHAVVAVGYNLDKGLVEVRNSWGTNWGQEGYFFMPLEFILSRQASDFWILLS